MLIWHKVTDWAYHFYRLNLGIICLEHTRKHKVEAKRKLTEAVVNRLRGSYQLFSTDMLKRCREFFNMVRVG